MIKRLIIVLVALAVVFGGIFGWKLFVGMKMAEMFARPQPPAVVASAKVEESSWQPYLTTVGSMVARRGVDVSGQLDGQVEKINFQSGQQVKQGEILVQLDDSVDRAELKGLIADEQLAAVEFRRQERLIKQRSTSQADYDQAQASLNKAKALVAAQQARIEHLAVRAPFSGMLGIRQVNLGEYLKAGSPVVTLQALDPLFVDFTLPERYLPQLAAQQKVLVQVPAYPKRTFEGRISAISSKIDSATRNVQVRATLANPDQALRPGMFAQVRVALPQRSHILTVPRTTITYNPYGNVVFLIEHKGKQLIVQRRQVDTGEVREGRVEIIKGLKLGDEVVAAGQLKLRNGQPVKINNTVKLDQQALHP